MKSMTGFAARDGQYEDEVSRYNWSWSLRTVNGKTLDTRLRLPNGFESLEQPLRKIAAEYLVRGNCQFSLQFKREAKSGGFHVNRDVLQAAIALNKELAAEYDIAPASLDTLLSIKGVVEDVAQENEQSKAELEKALTSDFRDCLVALSDARGQEGMQLKEIINRIVDEISELVQEAKTNPARSAEAVKAKLKQQLGQLLESDGLDADRLHQEAMLLAGKADIQEELDRLEAHIVSAQALIADTNAIGRRFDFLCQEFNREANTLCSKSNDADLTATGLKLKASIEQLREQIQNVE